MKHAFLIIAHSQYNILQVLVELLDHPQTDIFILIDKKSTMPDNICCKKSKLFLLKDRIDIRWGDISQIKAELLLFKTAFAVGNYSYYHLLSGVDLPIKPINYIVDFFEKNYGAEFVGFESGERWSYKINYYHFFTKYYKSQGCFSSTIDFFRKYLEILVNKFCKRVDDSSIIFKKGTNWCSVTEPFVEYLLSKEKFILKRFRHTMCGDEIFLQTILWNSTFRENIFLPSSEFDSCMREIDWNRGTPYVWGASVDDFTMLSQSKRLFARKFSNDFPDMIQLVRKLAIK